MAGQCIKHGVEAPSAHGGGTTQPGASDPTDLGHLSREVLEHAMRNLHAALVALVEEQGER